MPVCTLQFFAYLSRSNFQTYRLITQTTPKMTPMLTFKVLVLLKYRDCTFPYFLTFSTPEQNFKAQALMCKFSSCILRVCIFKYTALSLFRFDIFQYFRTLTMFKQYFKAPPLIDQSIAVLYLPVRFKTFYIRNARLGKFPP